MTSGRYELVLREVGRLLGGGTVASLGSGQLLERFASDRDEAAFEALVSQHGPMVLGTCRRMLSDPHDVDDAFQATFLVLARKAGSIQDADRLGPWLHGVARRVATRSRALSARRKSLERPGVEPSAVESPDLLEGVELRAALDEELSRLPEKYRAPLVLCYLEGLTHDEAARQLRWPVGTVRSRLAGGRDRLRDRLTRRGLSPSAAVPAVLPAGALPQALLSTTVRVATSAGTIPAHLASLAKGALIAMMWNKLKVVAAVGLMAGMTVGGAGVAAQKGGAGKPETSPDAPKAGPVMIDVRVVDSYETVEKVEREYKRIQAEAWQVKREIEQIRAAQGREIAELEKKLEGLNSIQEGLSDRYKVLAAEADPENPRNKIAGLEKALAVQKAQILALQDRRDPSRGSPSDEKRKVADPTSEVPAPIGAATGPAPSPASVVPMRDDYVMMISSEHDRVTSFNTKTGARASLQLRPGISVIEPKFIGPRFSSVGGLALQGSEVHQVAAFDLEFGKWYPTDLVEPAKVAIPLVHEKDVVYQVGRRIYVFSVPAKVWSVLELKADPGEILSMQGGGKGGGRMIVPEGDSLHIYDHDRGEWTHVEVKDRK